MKTILQSTGTIAALFISVLYMPTAGAQVVAVEFDGNDCSGQFTEPDGHGFGDCSIWIEDGGSLLSFAQVLAKIEEGGNVQTSDAFVSVDGDEFLVDAQQGSGSWEYTAGDDDPDILFWTAKGGNGFTLNWDIDPSAFLDNGGACDPSMLFSVDCLQAANPVSGSDFFTPLNPKNGKYYGLSHLTFYGSASVVPVPAAVWLFASGLLGLIAIARRRD